jgi:5-methylcytosine-specific restriction enzyme B
MQELFEAFKFNSTPAKTQRMAFLKWAKENGITSNEHGAWTISDDFTLEKYTSLVRDGDGTYFTNWLERKTDDCCRFNPASSYGYGVHRAKEEGDPMYRTADQKREESPSRAANHSNVTATFKRVKEVLTELMNFKDASSVAPLEINFARKVAYLFNPEKLLPLYNKATIQVIAGYFEIPNIDPSNYKATANILEKLKEWNGGTEPVDFTLKLGPFLYKIFGKPFSLESKSIIFYGAPGTGKTYTVEQGLREKFAIDPQNTDFDNQVYVAQFHPSYTYEDFIEGLRPELVNNQVTLALKSGQFKQFCIKATEALKRARQQGKDAPEFYFVADEINRAELSRVLGEVLVCLEDSKRIDFDKEGKLAPDSFTVHTQYSHLIQDEKNAVIWNEEEKKATFGIPANLYFIGTMNDIDRSIDSFDLALRRRFTWERMDCDYSALKEVLLDRKPDSSNVDDYIERCKKLNLLIATGWGLGSSYQIGHAYFMSVDKNLTMAARVRLFESKLAPLLREYLRADYSEPEIEKNIKVAKETFC